MKFKVEKFVVEVLRIFFNLINNCLLHSEKFYLKPGYKKSIKNSIQVIQGDIVQQKVDGIINSTDHALSTGLKVSHNVHKITGLELKEPCRKLNTCKYVEAKITRGYNSYA